MYQMSEADLRPQAASEDVVYRTIVVGRLACNCTILGNKRTREVRGAEQNGKAGETSFSRCSRVLLPFGQAPEH